MKAKIITLITVLLTFMSVSVIYADNDDFRQADYNRAVKGDKNLSNAQLEKADLHGIDLSGANLTNAELEDANLQGANLTNANLQRADLEGANLRGAKINGANLRGAELGYAIWVNGKVCAEDSVGSCW
jgi:uncharacterized protein YjbI with pentapeptide repeats